MAGAKEQYQGQYLGRQFGNYRLVKLLGWGGFAEVYLGEHVYLGTQAAVKVLTAKLTEGEIEQFRNEARIMLSLKHPNIMRVLDFGLAGPIPFIVMEYAPKGSLRTIYPRGTRLPPQTIVNYVKQVAAALQYVHEQKLIHRDIKPENMLLGHRNEVLLSDFGIAAVAQSTRSLERQDGSGTLYYMAPEQIQGKPRIASDQYSLGAVVYEWLCGMPPFNGTAMEVGMQHLLTPPSSLRGKVPTISADVEQVVLRALAKDPRQRFGSVQEFATTLEQACLDKKVSVLPPVKTSPPLGTTLFTYYGHSRHVDDVAWFPDGIRLISGSADATVQVWDAISGKRIASYSNPNVVTGVALSPDHTRITSAGFEPLVRIWDVATGNNIVICSGHSSFVYKAAWSPDSTRIASVSADRTVRIWDAASGRPIYTYNIPSPSGSFVNSLLGPLFSTSSSSSDHFWGTVDWSPNGTRLASAILLDKTGVQVWYANGDHIYTYQGHSLGVGGVAWSPNGKRIASASKDGTVHIWDAVDGGNVCRCLGHTNWVSGVAWSPDGTRIASASKDRTVRIWDAMNGSSIYCYRGHDDWVNAVAWSPDGMRIASASDDRTVHVWQAA